MEGLPRAPHNGDRRVVGSRAEERPEPVYRQPEPARLNDDSLRTPRRASEARAPKDKKSLNKIWLIASIVLVVAILGFVGWTVWSNGKSGQTGIDSSKYQSIHLMDGKIYFGKLSVQSNESFKLTNVYYLDIPVADAESANSNAAANPSLVRLSKAIYGPDDEMIIAKDQVLYFQNLTSDGKGAQLIENDK